MWIKTIPYDEAGSELRGQYDRQVRTLGEPTEMTTSGSLHPQLVQARLDLYSATERCPSRLTAHQRNLISYVTSALNRTGHCMSQVTIKLRQTGFSDDQISSLAADPLEADLPPADAALVRYAAKLTTDPGSIAEEDIEDLRRAGFADLEILDANSQCAHLNYVNRVAMGLGIHSIVDPDFPAYDAIPTAKEEA